MTTDIERGGIDVSSSHEPSYYEIALTNRQVVVAFVVLLTCLLAAFLSGVWIGRESASRAQEKLALLARGSGSGPANSDKEKPEAQALQEFKFFADPRHRTGAESASKPASRTSTTPVSAATSAAAAGLSLGSSSTAGAPSTLADDLHRSAQAATASPAATAARQARPPVPAPRPPANQASRDAAAGETPGALGSPAHGGEGEPLPTVAPAPAAADAATVRPRPLPDAPALPTSGGSAAVTTGNARDNRPPAAGAAAAATAETAGEVVIQVFSSADKDQADKVRDGLVNAGLQAFLSPIAKNGQTMYRVRLGPFPSRAAAEAVAEKVRKEKKLDTWITPK